MRLKYLKLMSNSSFRLITIFNVNGVKCKRLPIYDMYAASNFGKIIHVKKQKPILVFFTIWDIWNVKLKLRTNDVKQKVVIFIVFFYNAIIVEGYVVDHRNDIKINRQSTQKFAIIDATTEFKEVSSQFKAQQS